MRIEKPKSGLSIAGAFIALYLGLAYLVPTAGFSDTYNFFFTPKKKGNSQPAAPQSGDSEDSDDESENSETEKKAEKSPPKEKDSVSHSQAPVIIHNVNNVGTPAPSPTPTGVPTPSSPAPAVAIPSTPTPAPKLEETVNIAPTEKASRWKLTTSVMYYAPKIWWGSESEDKTAGALVSLNFAFSKRVGTTLFGGLHRGGTVVVAGLDLEISPFASSRTAFPDPIELALLVGASTGAASAGNIGSWHVGTRVGVNFSDSFGVTGSGRVNLGGWMLEAGIVTRL